MAIVDFRAIARPSALMRKMVHVQTSESSKARLLAHLVLFKRSVRFYEDGTRRMDGLTEDESQESEILRYIHASLIARRPVGDRSLLYVDAMKSPIEIIAYGRSLDVFAQDCLNLIRSGEMAADRLRDGAEDFRQAKEL